MGCMLFLVIRNQELRQHFLHGTEVARGMLKGWDPGEMSDSFERGVRRAKKLSHATFYEGLEIKGLEISGEGDSVLLRHRVPGKARAPFYPDNIHVFWDTARVIADLVDAGIWNRSWARRLAYVEKYHRLAVAEMIRSGIPASITLAQAVCESNSGKGTLARKANNHFGVKCRKKKGARFPYTDEEFWPGSVACGCMQHEDDNKWDRFRTYCGDRGVTDSFSDHTLVLENPRYEKLFGYQVSDTLYRLDKKWFGVEAVPYYAGAAAMLKAGGYATAPDYHWTIAAIIDRLQLWRIDFAVVNS